MVVSRVRIVGVSVVFLMASVLSLASFVFYWGRFPGWFELLVAPVLTAPISLPYSTRLTMEYLLGNIPLAYPYALWVAMSVAIAYWPLLVWSTTVWLRRGRVGALLVLVTLFGLSAIHWHFIAVAMTGV